MALEFDCKCLGWSDPTRKCYGCKQNKRLEDSAKLFESLDRFAEALERVYPCGFETLRLHFDRILEKWEDQFVLSKDARDHTQDDSVWRPQPYIVPEKYTQPGPMVWTTTAEDLQDAVFLKPGPGWIQTRGEPLEELAPELCRTLKDACRIRADQLRGAVARKKEELPAPESWRPDPGGVSSMVVGTLHYAYPGFTEDMSPPQGYLWTGRWYLASVYPVLASLFPRVNKAAEDGLFFVPHVPNCWVKAG